MIAAVAIIAGAGVLSRLISVIGKGFGRPQARHELPGAPSQGGSENPSGIRDSIDDLNTRVERLEEERDFYKDLLESTGSRREISPPNVEEGASDSTGPKP